jgi:hypothetical protein
MDPFDNDPLAPVRARFPEADWLAAEIVRDEKSTGVWINGTASYAYVEVLRNGRIHYYYEATKNGKAVEGVVATADQLPDALGLAMAAQDASRGMLTAERAGTPLRPQSDRPCENCAHNAHPGVFCPVEVAYRDDTRRGPCNCVQSRSGPTAATDERIEKIARAIRAERYARSRMTPAFPGQCVWDQDALDRAIARVDALLPPVDTTNRLRRSTEDAANADASAPRSS